MSCTYNDQLMAIQNDLIKMNLRPRDPELPFYKIFNLYNDSNKRHFIQIQNGL